jgi:meiotic recombination protein SPO11
MSQRIFVYTACKGRFPDIATRALVRKLADELQIPVLGLCDWNPFGISILLTYKLGSARMGLESYRYAVDLKWVGLRSGDFSAISFPDDVLQPMTRLDLQRLNSLEKAPFIASQPLWRFEVNAMRRRAIKVELEAIHSQGLSFLCEKYLVRLQ